MFIDFLLERFNEKENSDAIVWRDKVYPYSWIIDRIGYWSNKIKSEDIKAGSVVILDSDFSPNSVALLLALIENASIIVPLTSLIESKKNEFLKIAQAETIIKIDTSDIVQITKQEVTVDNELYNILRKAKTPGLVLFSSGSTGRSKAAVHDFSGLLRKFHTRRHDLRTLTFLLFDHIGGIDTMLYSLSNGSCIITVDNRSPEMICQVIEKHNVEVLPVTPTFLNLLILSQAYKKYDLSSLKYITYGTEVMPEVTLKRCVEILPDVTFLQKYGTSEIGTLRSKSKSSDSLWVKVGGEGFKTRIVDGILHVKAESAMLGYLNAPSPFSEDGWFITGDSVVKDGDFIKFLGRKSEIINVGGEKVFPSQVENVIQELDNIAEVVVYGEKNPIIGNIVCARVRLENEEDEKSVRVRIKRYCRERLENFMVPIKIELVKQKQYSQRFKKKRLND